MKFGIIVTSQNRILSTHKRLLPDFLSRTDTQCCALLDYCNLITVIYYFKK